MNPEHIEELLKKVVELMNELNGKQIDREELVQILVLSLFSLKHTFLLGEPGVSKTGILKILATAIDSRKSFSITIKNDTKYEEIFGDSYREDGGRLVSDFNNSIVEADFAIVDETWKGNSKIMNAFLSIMSDYRTVDIIGEGSVEVPLLMVGGASNELPTDIEVRPLRDRFLFSYKVEKISGSDDWIKFASRDYDTNPIMKTKFSPDEVRSINTLSKDVSIPDNIYKTLYAIRQKVVLLEIGVSDRKFDGAVDVFLVSAFLNKREEVDLSELFLMKHIMWNEEKDIPKIEKILNDEIFGQLDVVIKFIEEIENSQNKLLSVIDGQFADFLKFRRTYAYGDLEEFENKKNEIRNIIQNFLSLIKQTQSVISHHEQNMILEQIVDKNILVTNLYSPVYQNLKFSKVTDIYNQLTTKKESLDRWLKKNDALHTYNMEVNSV
ncbi:AAA family ATPase [Sulfurimonas sp.]|uniref:AAA family ATPase n=1 Tax=Sulfurimonas sp. TaxID=2022749 RepID=UPI0025DD95A9|nr:AAA family ATPase [Sulfurimonas sp.]